MSLNDVNLSPYLFTHLYSNCLIADFKKSNPTTSNTPEKMQNVSDVNWKQLGNNKRNVLIAVKYENTTHLPDEQLDFLVQLLTACQLSLNDITVINLNNYQGITHTDILNHFNTKIILLFGISAQQFGFPFEIPQYQVQTFTTYTVVHAPALQNLQNDKPAKGLLWSALKKTFNI